MDSITVRSPILAPMTISGHHSINRVKRSLLAAAGKKSVRAARHRIACRKWLGQRRWQW